jgi:NitT/TauT family transport system ATP-binding protein
MAPGLAVAVSDDAAIFARGLTKTYGPLRALDNLDFFVRDGEFVCLVGPSGCGKSTLIKMLAGLVSPTSGELLLDGYPPGHKSQIAGLVFQAPVLLPWRSVLQNVLLPADVLNLPRAAAFARARALLAMAGLAGFEDAYPAQLSGGMQQRCSIVRALLHDPALLLMDEPFGALDAMTRDQMNLELLRIWQASRKTVFLITHSISEAVFLADRVLVMSPRPGRILDTVPIDLPRPRDLDMMTSENFGAAVRRIRARLGLAGTKILHAE